MLIERTIVSVIEFVPKVIMDILQELSKQVVLNEQDRLDLNLLLEEAVTNAIQHGNQFDTSQTVKLSLEYDGQGMVTMRVRDQGQGFDHTVQPDLKENNEQMNDGGRGVFLIKQMADQVSFNETGNEICIRKKIHLGKL